MSDTKQIDDGGPAFPMPAHSGANGEQTYPIYGMTLRDWFAGQALAGIMACPEGVDWDAEITARNAYKQADAMLAARKEKQ